MEKRAIQEKMLRKLMSMKPPKWGNSHTEERNLTKGLPSHLVGSKAAKDAVKELHKLGFLLSKKSTGETHVSLNPQKMGEIFEFLGLG